MKITENKNTSSVLISNSAITEIKNAAIKEAKKNNGSVEKALDLAIELIQELQKIKVEYLLKPVPAVPIEESVNDDYIVCLEDGNKCKILSTHIRNRYQMTEKEYIERWGLPSDYPFVAQSTKMKKRATAKKHVFWEKNNPKFNKTMA